jgi:septum formation protein
MLELNKKIILASGSPRRRELLGKILSSFEVKVKNTSEDYPSNVEIDQIAAYLAWKKASVFKSELRDDELVLAADTTVIFEGKLLEKPSNKSDALAMLRLLSGNVHQVITGVCLLDDKKEVTFQDEAKVFFKKLSEEEIDYYIENFKPFDKAGSYGIQEWLGCIGIPKIEGSYYTIMGLPIHRVYEELLKW